MKGKTGVTQGQERYENVTSEFHLHRERIKRILNDTIRKLKILGHLPLLLENEGALLRSYLNKTEADFVYMVCQDFASFSKQITESRSDLLLMVNMLERINVMENKGSRIKTGKALSPDHFDIHVAYAVDLILKNHQLVAYLESLEEEQDPLVVAFIDAMSQLEEIVSERLNVSAVDEIKRENDLKTAYRSSMMLSNNIQELEELLEKQRQELSKEHDRKESILHDLSDKIEKLKQKCNYEINKIVYESEINMMKDYNRSAEKQEELSQEAKNATYMYDSLLEEHLAKEKVLRAKRLKIEAQLASWVAKYDSDIGEKQAEYDELEKEYNEEKSQLDELQEMFEDQEEEYVVLMKEKEEEEERIREEKAWIFLQNRAARRIQRAWKAYKERKLAKKKGRKSKKKEKGSAGSHKGKGKGKKEEEIPTIPSGPDPNATLAKAFSEAVLGEIKSKEAFSKHDIVVDLMND